MKFDMNSVSSQSLSSGYAIAMKKMARRQARAMARKGQLGKSSESGILYEPCHEKIVYCHKRTTKAQISLRIHTV